MDKKKIMIIGGIIGLVVIGAGVFFLTKPEKENGDSGVFSFLFPNSDDRPAPITTPDKENNGNIYENSDNKDSKERNLIQIVDKPVAGAMWSSSKNKVNYFEKSSGNLYEIIHDGSVKNQLSITTIPQIFEILWSADGDKALIKYLTPENNSNTQRMIIFPSLSAVNKDLNGIILSPEIYSAAISPKNAFFYLVQTETGTIMVNAPLSDLKKTTTLLTPPFDEFLAFFPNEKTQAVMTKPSNYEYGYLYEIDEKTGVLNKILEDINGLTILYSSSTNKIICSESTNRSLTTSIYDKKTKSGSKMNYKTLPEKCFFSKKDENTIFCAVPKQLPDALYPDDWYKGIISFEDNLWKINILTGTTELLLEQNDFDMINIFTDDNETYLFFMNKKDGTLWSLKLPVNQ